MNEITFQRSAVDASGAFSTAWEMVKGKYGMYLGISIIALVLTGCIPCLNVFLIGPVMGGIAYVVLRDQNGEPVEFGMMFKGFEKFVPLMVIGLIQSIPGMIGQGIQYTARIGELGLGGGGRNAGRSNEFLQSGGSDAIAPFLAGGMLVVVIVVALIVMVFALLWWACLFCAVPLAMEYDLGPVEAMKLSAQAALANVGGMIVVLILSILIALVGMLLLCVGMFLISIPVMYVGNVLVYRQIFPRLRAQFDYNPPPPAAYGFGS